MTKIGLLVECGRDGLEVVVCRKICQLIAGDRKLSLEVEIVPMDNKARLLECVLSTKEHPVRVPRPSRPDKHANPKGAMTTLFRKHGGRPYVDVQFARRFAECLDGLNHLRRCKTFKRFEERVAGSS